MITYNKHDVGMDVVGNDELSLIVVNPGKQTRLDQTIYFIQDADLIFGQTTIRKEIIIHVWEVRPMLIPIMEHVAGLDLLVMMQHPLSSAAASLYTRYIII